MGGYLTLDSQFEEIDPAGLSLSVAQRAALMNKSMEKIVEAERPTAQGEASELGDK